MVKNLKDLVKFPYTFEYKGTIETVDLYFKPLEVKRFDSGIIESYKVLIVYEIEKYLNNENPVSSEVKVFQSQSAPDMIKLVMDNKEF